ncbi:DUF2911 domain-containing protein [Psychroflexus sediminis]|uniref:DUF2911 domain-containing protein n=1 Tax=Psychroflexus sediminis TaxID=470826 RepID=A0A1G7VY09_9FLAO|nr:DUF2911 domain-containing protein [Psychroflexus sediminis]SDG64593.1 Protein of unknown function [Psychroflexus sediminis]
MKKIALVICIFLISISCKHENKNDRSSDHEHEVKVSETETKKTLSPHTSEMAVIDGAHIHIDYSSPGVRNRMIFGGLLAYDEVWQAGAHRATWIETDKDLEIEGKLLEAGKYGFFVIPSQENAWTLIFNTHWDQHGKDEYNKDQDVLRVKAEPSKNDSLTEHLTYTIEQTGDDTGMIRMSWENQSIQIPFKVI